MPDTRRFEFHVTKELDAKIDAWRRQHPDLPDRSKAARLLIQQGIDADADAGEPGASIAYREALPAPPPAKPIKDPPWRAANIQQGNTIACNVQIDQALSAKIRWLLKQNDRVKRDFVETALNQYVAAEMARLGVKP
jgi:hypothetical protein